MVKVQERLFSEHFLGSGPLSMDTAATVGDGSILWRRWGEKIVNEHWSLGTLSRKQTVVNEHCTALLVIWSVSVSYSGQRGGGAGGNCSLNTF